MIEPDVELDRLAVDLGRAGRRAARQTERVVSRGAHNVTMDARKMAEGSVHAPHFPRSITFDMDFSGGKIAAEIGPDKNLTQGALGNLIEYGSVNNAPHPVLGPSLDREEPAFFEHMGDVGESALE